MTEFLFMLLPLAKHFGSLFSYRIDEYSRDWLIGCFEIRSFSRKSDDSGMVSGRFDHFEALMLP